MPKTPGYSEFKCDRVPCGATVFAKEGKSGYTPVTYVNQDGIPTDWFLCPKCYPIYKKSIATKDKQINDWMGL